MTKENLLVRVLGSCETMANASVICTDKTGTLTQNVMSVVAGSIGTHIKFVRGLDQNQTHASRSDTQGRPGSDDLNSDIGRRRDIPIDQSRLTTVLPPQLCKLLNAAIAINSTAFEDVDADSGKAVFIGNKTETALLGFAKDLGFQDYKEVRDGADVVQMIPFSSERKAMGVVVRLPNGKYRFHVKGASEILAGLCTHHVVASKISVAADSKDEEVEVAPLEGHDKENISRTIIYYANESFRTIAICYRDFTEWPPVGIPLTDDDEVCSADPLWTISSMLPGTL